jgi:hypothetical protein
MFFKVAYGKKLLTASTFPFLAAVIRGDSANPRLARSMLEILLSLK